MGWSVAAKRVQFNVRVREEVARDLRSEAAQRAIGMGELVELLNENYRAGTRSGHWLELDPTLEAALTALAAVRSEDPEKVLQGLVAGVVRQQLQKILDHLPSSEDILTSAVISEVSSRATSTSPGGDDELDELEIDASGWIEPSESDVSIEGMEWDGSSEDDVSLEAMEWDGSSEDDEVIAAPEFDGELEDEPNGGSGDGWEGSAERRRRSREVQLNEEDQRRLDALHPSLPRSGEQLRSFRQQHGLSPSQLGELCGVTQVAVGLWEKKGQLSSPILLKLGAGLSRYFPGA